ncbi:polysaccharide deacetylase family protein [Palleronia rufa]
MTSYDRDMSPTRDSMNRPAPGGGGFVLSLDLELMWGHAGDPRAHEKMAVVLAGRMAVPPLLDLLAKHEAHATWAAVGLLFHETRESLFDALPVFRPSYGDPSLASYTNLCDVGPDEASDPFHFGMALLELIRQTPGQEIASHTFSQYYCLEAPFDHIAFDADLAAAVKSAAALGLAMRTLVFPRNQICREAVEICVRHGFDIVRGQGGGWYDRPASRGGDMAVKRAARLARSFFAFDGTGPERIGRYGPATNVPASRMLLPVGQAVGPMIMRQARTIVADMRRAAEKGEIYHLWFHPNAFGTETEANLAILDILLAEAGRLGAEYGWPSLNMAEAADLHTPALPPVTDIEEFA